MGDKERISELEARVAALTTALGGVHENSTEEYMRRVIREALAAAVPQPPREQGGPKRPEYEPKSAEQAVAYLVEECGEVLAAAGKSLRWGLASTNPELPPEERETNATWLAREMLDLQAAIVRVQLRIVGPAVPQGEPPPWVGYSPHMPKGEPTPAPQRDEWSGLGRANNIPQPAPASPPRDESVCPPGWEVRYSLLYQKWVIECLGWPPRDVYKTEAKAVSAAWSWLRKHGYAPTVSREVVEAAVRASERAKVEAGVVAYLRRRASMGHLIERATGENRAMEISLGDARAYEPTERPAASGKDGAT